MSKVTGVENVQLPRRRMKCPKFMCALKKKKKKKVKQEREKKSV